LREAGRRALANVSSELRDQLQSTLGSSYTIERELGGGGMSRVFVAREVALGRAVVVKVLPPDLSGVMSAERFRREIQLAASLHHPHIVPVLTAGDANGLLYYTMPLVDGESLRSKLSREGELSIQDATRLLQQVADALSYAHEHGVVHRDLKPENILISGRHAHVVDFGVAKALSASTMSGSDSGLTSIGVALGTPAYMAPEQAAADPQSDHRVDLYALGVVAYEALTGAHPFAGRRAQALLVAHATERPEPIAKRRPSIPASLASLVERLLEKRPADRPASAEQVLRELDVVPTPTDVRPAGASLGQSASTGSATVPTFATGGDGARRIRRWGILGGAIGGAALAIGLIFLAGHRRAPVLEAKRVVVATFANKTGDRSLDPLGGMAADWIARGLARTGVVDVGGTAAEIAARTNASEAVNLQALAEQARAGLVISGAYYRQGDSVLLEADFTDARTQRLLQSVGPISAPLTSPLQGVEKLRQRVTGSLAAVLDPRLADVAGATSQPPSYDAYREFLVGDELFYSDDSAAILHYRNAAALDSTYLYPVLRELSALLNRREWGHAEDSLGEALERKRSTLSPYEAAYLDGILADARNDAHGAYDAAVGLMRAAPKADFPVYLAADYANGINRPREAIALLQRVDPEGGALRGRIYYFDYYGSALHALGEHEKELEVGKRALQLYPNRLYVSFVEIHALAALGRTRELESLLREVRAMPPDLRRDATDAYCLAIYELRAHDHPDAARSVSDELRAWLAARSHTEAASMPARFERARALAALQQWADLRSVADSLFAEDSSNLNAKALSALAEAETADRADAKRIAATIFSRATRSGDGLAQDWRATISAALGDKAEAFAQLQQGYPRGAVRDYSWHGTIVYELLRDYPPFQEYIKPKG
jgi:tetratricopeptide (TPR) repeat protein/TolB-like protein